MKKTEQSAVHLSSDTKEVLMLLAEQNGNSVSEFVCDLIEADLQRIEKMDASHRIGGN